MNKKWKKFIFQLLPRFFPTVALNWLLWSAECQEEDARYSLATIGNIIGNNQEGKRSTESERDWEILLLKNTFFFYSRATVTLTGHDIWTSQRSQPDIHRKSALLPVCSWLSTGRLSGELQSLLNHCRARFSVAPLFSGCLYYPKISPDTLLYSFTLLARNFAAVIIKMYSIVYR